MPITTCRVCDAPALEPVLDLGRTALANRFLRPDRLGEPELTYPLRLARCGGCGLIQIDETVPREELFAHYVYVTGTSDAAVRHAARLARDTVELLGLQPGDLVLEAASNDGTVLKAFQPYGVRTLGVEPAANIAERARGRGVETVCEFFDAGCARRLRESHGPARLVLARHVLAHVADLHGFVAGLREALADDGAAVVEVPHLLPFHNRLEYDTVYHEHLCYYSVEVLQTLLARHGLELIDAEEVDLHGGSVLLTAQRRGGPRFRRAGVDRLLAREERVGLHHPRTWETFARRVLRSRDTLREELADLRAGGRSVAGYGAAAKGMTLLAFAGLGPESVPFIVDKNPLKQGLLTPGHHIPVCGPERLDREPPDVMLVLAWNFAAEVAEQQAGYLRRGGRLLLPVPQAHYWHEAPAVSRPAVRGLAS
jgi:novobiocin biosynthesis protein NovU/D-mycarose 3-C-methyltransferase